MDTKPYVGIVYAIFALAFACALFVAIYIEASRTDFLIVTLYLVGVFVLIHLINKKSN